MAPRGVDETDSGNSWNEWRRAILEELKRHNEVLSGLIKQMNELNVRMSVLEVKAGFWGALAGAAVTAASAIGHYVYNHK